MNCTIGCQTLYSFYQLQSYIDVLRMKNVRISKHVKCFMINTFINKTNFKFIKKLNTIDLFVLYNILNDANKINKKTAISYFEAMKIELITGVKNYPKIEVHKLQALSDFIFERKDLMTDEEFKESLEYIQKFY